MDNPILYIILNKELNMSPGKASAQAVHAAMMLESKCRDSFTAQYRRTVVILEAQGREQLDGISDYLHDAGIYHEYYTDEGINEVEAFSFTALAVEPIEASDEKKREIFSSLKLFSGKPDAKTSYDRAANAIREAIPYQTDRRRFVKKTLNWLDKKK